MVEIRFIPFILRVSAEPSQFRTQRRSFLRTEWTTGFRKQVHANPSHFNTLGVFWPVEVPGLTKEAGVF